MLRRFIGTQPMERLIDQQYFRLQRQSRCNAYFCLIQSIQRPDRIFLYICQTGKFQYFFHFVFLFCTADTIDPAQKPHILPYRHLLIQSTALGDIRNLFSALCSIFPDILSFQFHTAAIFQQISG